MSRYRWALRPGWILSHVFVLCCVVAFVRLGLWQHDRLDGRREINAMIQAREAAPPVPVGQLVQADLPMGDIGDGVFRRATATGTYRVADQVLINNRTNEGAPGYWVLTPLALPDGTLIAVNRGWIPLQLGDQPNGDGYAPPSGTVTVTGLVLDTQHQEGLGVSDAPTGTVKSLARVDLPRLQQQLAGRLLPAYLQLGQQDPAQPSFVPAPIPPPVLDDGSHLNYMGQWFIFAALTCIVYPLLLRRTARNKELDARQAAIDAGDLADPDPAATRRAAGLADPSATDAAAAPGRADPTRPSDPVTGGSPTERVP